MTQPKIQLLFDNRRPDCTALDALYEAETGLDGQNRKILKVHGNAIVCDKVGINGRLYPLPIMKREVDKFIKTRILQGRSSAEMNHPRIDEKGNGIDGSIYEINFKKVCALIEELKLVGDTVKIKYRVTRSMNGNLTTPGDILANLIDHGLKPGCSLRGAGSASKHPKGYQIVSPDYNLITVDIVGNPSFDIDAMLDTTYESIQKQTILMESVGDDVQRSILDGATNEFLYQLNSSARINMIESKNNYRTTALLEYLQTAVNL